MHVCVYIYICTLREMYNAGYINVYMCVYVLCIYMYMCVCIYKHTCSNYTTKDVVGRVG